MSRLWNLLLFTILLLITGCGNSNTIETATAVCTEGPLRITRQAELQSLHNAVIVAPISGRLDGDLPTVGAAIREGDLLFSIDTSPYEAQLARGTEMVAVPPPETPAAVREAENLLNEGIITRSEYETIRAREEAKMPPASVPAFDVETEKMRRAIAAGNVLAPISGRIGAVYAEPNGVLVAGRPVLTVQSITPLIANFPLPAVAAHAAEVDFRAPGNIVKLTGPDGDHYGEIIAAGYDEFELGMLKLRFENDPPVLLPAEAYPITLQLDISYPLIKIPLRAAADETTVYVVDEQGIVDLRNVITAYKEGNNWYLIAGIKEGEKVILDPSPELEIGMQVNI